MQSQIAVGLENGGSLIAHDGVLITFGQHVQHCGDIQNRFIQAVHGAVKIRMAQNRWIVAGVHAAAVRHLLDLAAHQLAGEEGGQP